MTNSKQVRVRFAPSPTGPLHIGGVRTALYNYLFARQNQGTFVLRIEDTDQTRYVPGAEEYILESLNWLGLQPEESVENPGDFGPYRQSERKDIYKKYVDQLINKGHAYYAFDTPEELEQMRNSQKEKGNHTPKYDWQIRTTMRNSLTLKPGEVSDLLAKGENITVRMKVPENEVVTFSDEIRGSVSFNSSELDDKVILKADGLPTYHLANVVDDRLMQITHVIRGEEWLSSTAHHILLYRSFGWEDEKPVFAHLPLILKPSGKGKLSKRDGAKFGFPVFPLEWSDTKEHTTYMGFRESGFLPDALLNFLSLLGWNPGTEQELFTITELVDAFNLDQINKSGAQFNYDKAQWFNQQYINKADPKSLYHLIKSQFTDDVTQGYLESVITQLQPRVTFLNEFKEKSEFYFNPPQALDEKAIKKKFRIENSTHFVNVANLIEKEKGGVEALQNVVKGYIQEQSLSFGAIFPLLRVFITGSMQGPDLFEMISVIGTSECAERIRNGTKYASKNHSDV